MKRLFSLSGLLLLVVSAAQAGVGLGVASELSISSPLMGTGQSSSLLALPSANVTPTPVYKPNAARLRSTPPNVVAPLAGASPQAPVVVTVGPAVHQDGGLWAHMGDTGHQEQEGLKQRAAAKQNGPALVSVRNLVHRP